MQRCKDEGWHEALGKLVTVQTTGGGMKGEVDETSVEGDGVLTLGNRAAGMWPPGRRAAIEEPITEFRKDCSGRSGTRAQGRG